MNALDWFLSQTATDPLGPLLQYGALGVLAALSILAVRVLFHQQTKAHDLDRTRADRLEQELRQLNKDVQELVMPAVTRSTEALTEAMRLMRDR